MFSDEYYELAAKEYCRLMNYATHIQIRDGNSVNPAWKQYADQMKSEDAMKEARKLAIEKQYQVGKRYD